MSEENYLLIKDSHCVIMENVFYSIKSHHTLISGEILLNKLYRRGAFSIFFVSYFILAHLSLLSLTSKINMSAVITVDIIQYNRRDDIIYIEYYRQNPLSFFLVV